MIILVALSVITLIGYYLEREWYDLLGFAMMLVGGAMLLISLIILGTSHLEAKGQVAHYNEVLTSIENMKDANVSESEVIILSQKIIEVNTFIAEANAYNDGLLDIFIPDKVADLQPIRYDK